MDLNPDQRRGRLQAQAAITAYMNGDTATSASILFDVISEENADVVGGFYRFILEVLSGAVRLMGEEMDIDAMGVLQDLFLSLDADTE